MIDFLDFLNHLIIGGNDSGVGTSAMDVMHNYVQQHLNFDLQPDAIVQSVQDASAFFNEVMPSAIQYGDMTGVCTHLSDTMADDVLYINPEQMANMHLTAQDAFDLVMTHECAHRALQGVSVSFSLHQEELCCDGLTGVRAALNPEDISRDAIDAMKASLINTDANDTHPAGENRVNMIDEGMRFAQAYCAEHHCAPTLQECIDHFKELQEFKDAGNMHELLALRVDDAVADGLKTSGPSTELENVDSAEITSDDSVHGFVNDKEYHEREARKAGEDMDYHAKEMSNAAARGDKTAMQNHKSKMDSAKSRMNDHLRSAQMCTPKGFTASVPFGSVFSAEQPMFTYDQLLDAGFSDQLAKNMLNSDMPHSYSQQELHDVLYSDNPLEAYNQMMDAKAQAILNQSDALEKQICRDFGIFTTI